MITILNLNKKLSFIKFINLDIRIVINFNYTRYFFIDYLLFIIYILKFNFDFDLLKILKISKFNFLFVILLILIIILITNALC